MAVAQEIQGAAELLPAAMLSEDGRNDPYPYLSERHGFGDATWMSEGYLAVWGHAACVEVMRSPQWGRRPPDQTIRATWQHAISAEQADQLRREDAPDLGPWLQLLDGEEHIHQRMTVNRAFSPKRLAVVRDQIAHTVHQLADRVVPASRSTSRPRSPTRCRQQ